MPGAEIRRKTPFCGLSSRPAKKYLRAAAATPD
jgi:hypothetical protein